MLIKLKPLPKADGAPFYCSRYKRLNEWPFVKRCENKASGLLSERAYEYFTHAGFDLGGTLICQECLNNIVDSFAEPTIENDFH